MTLLSLEQFRKILGYHPWHFWGLADSVIFPLTSKCNSAVYKYAWQAANAAGREDILEAIAQAEDMLTREVGFSPAPRWTEEILDIPGYYTPTVWNMAQAQADGRWRELTATEGYLEEFGKETLTLLGTQAVVLSDPDGDGINEVFTTSIVTALTDTDEIEVYFAAADRIDSEAVSEKYKISPVNIVISGGTATIKGKAWQIVDPVLYENLSVGALDPTVAANFVTTLEIYRHYTDVEGQATTNCHALLIWETDPYPMWACSGSSLSFSDGSSDPAALGYGISRAGIRHAREGIFYFGRAIYNTTTSFWEQAAWGACYPPARVQVRYKAGYPLKSGEMDRQFQQAVARLAMAELEERICACEQANRELYRWQFDISTTRGPAGETYTPTASLSNPFGTRRGHIYAWDFVKRWRRVPVVTF